MHALKFALVALLVSIGSAALAAPNAADVAAVAANPSLLGDHISGADAATASEFATAVIQQIEGDAALSEADKEKLVLDIVTRYTVLAGTDAPAWLASLTTKLGDYARIGKVVAAAMIAGGENGAAIWAAIEAALKEAGNANALAAATAAAQNPQAYLGSGALASLTEVLKALGFNGVLAQPAPGEAAPSYPGQL